MFRFLKALILAALVLGTASVSQAHVDWTVLNKLGAGPNEAYAIYHFDETGVLPNASNISFEGSFPAGVYPLVIANGVGGSITGTSDVFDVGIPADTGSLTFSGPTLAAIVSGGGVQTPDYNSATFDFWFKWDSPLTTAQEVQVGARSAAKIVIKRDPITPANDRFGLIFAHNDYLSAPGWVNGTTTWNDFSAEAPVGDWIHVGVATSSTGLENTSPEAVLLGHELFKPGSKIWIYVNGHKFGISPNDFVDVGASNTIIDYSTGLPAPSQPRGIRAHDATRFQVDNKSGSIKIDELSFWNVDLTAGGTIAGTSAAVFGDGRTYVIPPSSVANWSIY